MTDNTQIRFRTLEDVTVAEVQAAELTGRAAEQLQEAVRGLVDNGRPVRLAVDLSRVRFMNSVALGMLVVLLRRVRAAEGQLALVGLGEHSMRILEVTGLEKVFTLCDSVEQAAERMARDES